MTIRFRTASFGTNKKMIEWFASKNDSTQEQVQQRPVLTPDEIGRPINNITTFFLPNTPVFQGFLTPYYQDPNMRERIAEFDSPSLQLKLRNEPIQFEDESLTALVNGEVSVSSSGGGGNSGGGGGNSGLRPGITDTRGWSEEQVKNKLAEVKNQIGWNETAGSARKWWEAFENENLTRMALVLRLSEELLVRNATITEFFLAYVYSNTDNIQANLNYLDYTRLKKEEEKKKAQQGMQVPM
jgi:hypothetical protein